MLASEPKHLNYIVIVKKYCEKISNSSIYLCTFGKFIDNVSSDADPQQQQ
jgi:hypothetical protein